MFNGFRVIDKVLSLFNDCTRMDNMGNHYKNVFGVGVDVRAGASQGGMQRLTKIWFAFSPIDAVPFPTPIAFQPLPSSVAVRAEDSAILSALKAMEQRLTALATDVSSLQREVHQKDSSSSAVFTDRKRSGSRAASRQRDRVPVGKRLHIG